MADYPVQRRGPARLRGREDPGPTSRCTSRPSPTAARADPHRLRPGTGRGPPDIGNGAKSPRRCGAAARI